VTEKDPWRGAVETGDRSEERTSGGAEAIRVRDLGFWGRDVWCGLRSGAGRV
jgi:hypothetical protein